jgi:hypothetical protein
LSSFNNSFYCILLFFRRKLFEKQILALNVRPKGRNFILVAEHETAMWVVDAVSLKNNNNNNV